MGCLKSFDIRCIVVAHSFMLYSLYLVFSIEIVIVVEINVTHMCQYFYIFSKVLATLKLWGNYFSHS